MAKKQSKIAKSDETESVKKKTKSGQNVAKSAKSSQKHLKAAKAAKAVRRCKTKTGEKWPEVVKKLLKL